MKRRKLLLSGLVFVLACSALLWLVLLILGVNPNRPLATYPGKSTSGGWSHTAAMTLQTSAIGYYKVYGQFPANWKAVRERGIVQVDLRGYWMHVIDPDDGRLDFAGDAVYMVSADQKSAWVVTEDASKLSHQTPISRPGLTYSEFFAAIRRSGGTDLPTLYDENWLKLFAILAQCQTAADQYKMLHGSYPEDFGGLLESGLAPIDTRSVNPVTQRHFTGDGTAGDVFYRVQRGRLELEHVDESAERTKNRFSY